MRTNAVVMDSFGGPEVLHLDQVEVQRESSDEVLLRVLAVSVNHLDVDIREGTSRMPFTFPHVLGREIVGEIVELAEASQATTVLKPGDRVLVLPNAPCGHCSLCVRGRANRRA